MYGKLTFLEEISSSIISIHMINDVIQTMKLSVPSSVIVHFSFYVEKTEHILSDGATIGTYLYEIENQLLHRLGFFGLKLKHYRATSVFSQKSVSALLESFRHKKKTL